MRKIIFTLLLTLWVQHSPAQNTQSSTLNKAQIKEDLGVLLRTLSEDYVYFEEKGVGLDCLTKHYEQQIEKLQSPSEVVLLFEYLLDEFYDSHLILNTNVAASYRLSCPLYVTLENGKFIVKNVWSEQFTHPIQEIIGAEVLKINDIAINTAIHLFPTACNDKLSPQVQEWIANKLLAGRYNAPRIVELKLLNQQLLRLDIDSLQLSTSNTLLKSYRIGEMGVIKINNSLGDNALIRAFDKALDSLADTKGLIIDLRNTVDGGNSYVARGIMGRFITHTMPYQKHALWEQYEPNVAVERSWLEYVSPRLRPYQQPVVVLVGRWTGSMGEGLAIGLESAAKVKIVGTEMERLAGEMNGYSFNYQPFGYRISTARLFHVNGTAREKYLPTYYITQTQVNKDEALERALLLLQK